jgi:cell division protein FtsL
MTKSIENVRNWIDKAIITVFTTIFTAVSIWLGSTMNNMSQEVAKLRVSMENQVKLSDEYKTEIRVINEALSAIKIEQAKRTGDVYSIERLRREIDLLKDEIDKLKK